MAGMGWSTRISSDKLLRPNLSHFQNSSWHLLNLSRAPSTKPSDFLRRYQNFPTKPRVSPAGDTAFYLPCPAGHSPCLQCTQSKATTLGHPFPRLSTARILVQLSILQVVIGHPASRSALTSSRLSTQPHVKPHQRPDTFPAVLFRALYYSHIGLLSYSMLGTDPFHFVFLYSEQPSLRQLYRFLIFLSPGVLFTVSSLRHTPPSPALNR